MNSFCFNSLILHSFSLRVFSVESNVQESQIKEISVQTDNDIVHEKLREENTRLRHELQEARVEIKRLSNCATRFDTENFKD